MFPDRLTSAPFQIITYFFFFNYESEILDFPVVLFSSLIVVLFFFFPRFFLLKLRVHKLESLLKAFYSASATQKLVMSTLW